MIEKSWQDQSRGIHHWFRSRFPAIGIGTASEVHFLALALGGECGELQNVIKKCWRGDSGFAAKREEIASEIADIRIYMEHLADALGIDVDEACRKKIAELQKRWPDAFAPLSPDQPGKSSS